MLPGKRSYFINSDNLWTAKNKYKAYNERFIISNNKLKAVK